MPQNSSLSQRLFSRIGFQALGLRDCSRERVFVTGLSRTGTTSITRALERLGYRAIHWPPLVGLEADGGISLQWPWWMETYDAFSDIPVAAFFRELDARFPNAKFIETRRSKEKWLQSCREHFSVPSVHEEARRLHLAIYGSDVYDEKLFSEAYDRHLAEVREHFAGRSNYLEIALVEGAGWEELCAFLGKPIPGEPVPFENSARYFQITKSGRDRLDQRLAERGLAHFQGHRSDGEGLSRLQELDSRITGEMLERDAVLHARQWGYIFDALELPLDLAQDLTPATPPVTTARAA